MKEQSQYYLRLLAVPLGLVVVFGSLFIVWNILSLPTGPEFTNLVKIWFADYGLPLVFIASVLEGLLLIGNYFPGSFVIIFGIALAESLSAALLILLVATTGLLIAHCFNYLLGKYGWYKLLEKFGFAASIEKSRQKLLRQGGWAIFGSYWLPSMAAVIDSAAGVLKMPFRKFLLLAVVSSVFWNTLVMVIIYSLGDRAIKGLESDSTNIGLIMGIILIWMLILVILDWRKRRRGNIILK